MKNIFQIMFSKKGLPVLLLVLIGGLFVAYRSLGIGDNPPSKYEKILHDIGDILTQEHYSPKKIDDNFSKEIFKKYLAAVDAEKSFFLQSDIQQLKSVYETKIDNEINGGEVKFVPAVYAIYKQRVDEVEVIVKDQLSKPFEFKTEETLISDPEKMDYCKNEAARQDLWRKRLKYLVLERYSEALDTQEKFKQGKLKDSTFVVKTKEQMESDARDKVRKIMDRTFNKYKTKFTQDDQFNLFVNTITTAMDPHTAFFPPVDKRSFDEQMSGRFFGIGAALRAEDGGMKITSLVTGSPAWKSQQFAVGDVITKVAQSTGEPIDLAGFDLEDAVKLIRGEKGTEVKLTIRKVDGTIKQVSLIRDEIVQDETFARSLIVNNEGRKIGYIFLPEFYADFDNPKGARCAVDVAKEVMKLKEENVEGIVLDLRNNGGGSLYDVVQMVGLFIEDGPVVQVRDRSGKSSILRDRDKTVLYSGPLTVMVNEFSASASEIFAAAIQDYKRGVIVGSTTTYGKGTVQRNIGLDKENNLFFASTNSDLGTIKLTLQKFYRINGGSTQLKGVSSDVVLPDVFEYAKLREKDDPDALPWDEIQKADYKLWKSDFDMDLVCKRSVDRVNTNVAFNDIKAKTIQLNKENDKVYSLNFDKFKEEKKRISSLVKDLDTLNKLPKELNIAPLPKEVDKYVNDKDKDERYKQWQKLLRTDVYLNEAVNVINDMASQISLAKSK